MWPDFLKTCFAIFLYFHFTKMLKDVGKKKLCRFNHFEKRKRNLLKITNYLKVTNLVVNSPTF